MPDDAERDAAFYDHENEPRRHVADWGGDDLFTRVPRRRELHAGAAPRFRRPAPIDPIHRPSPGEPTGRFRRENGPADGPGEPTDRFQRDDGRPADGSGEPTGRFRREDGSAASGEPTRRFRRDDGPTASRERLGAAPADGEGWPDSAGDRWPHAVHSYEDGAFSRANGELAPRGPAPRRTVVIGGRPDGVARPLPQRRRPPRTVAERVGPRPERIVAWAFALGLLLILIAIATADAATL